MWIFILWLILAVIVAVYASNKGRSGLGFFFLSLALSPIVGFFIAAVSRRNPEVIAQRTGMKKCPDCAELVQGEARVCRFCGHKFSVDSAGIVVEEPEVRGEESQARRKELKQFLIVFFVVIAGIVIWSFFAADKSQRDGQDGQAINEGIEPEAANPKLWCSVADPAAEKTAWDHIHESQHNGIAVTTRLKAKYNEPPNGSAFEFASTTEPAHIAHTEVVHIRLGALGRCEMIPPETKEPANLAGQ